MNNVMGIDPGINGGLTILRQDTGHVEITIGFDPKWTHQEFVTVLVAGVKRLEISAPVALEKVGFIRGDGGKGAFTFGRVDGLIRGTLLALGHPIVEIPPMLWQGALRCLTGGDKNVTKRRAAELWPQEKWTHKTADSALIAEYLRRRNAQRRSLL